MRPPFVCFIVFVVMSPFMLIPSAQAQVAKCTTSSGSSSYGTCVSSGDGPTIGIAMAYTADRSIDCAWLISDLRRAVENYCARLDGGTLHAEQTSDLSCEDDVYLDEKDWETRFFVLAANTAKETKSAHYPDLPAGSFNVSYLTFECKNK